MKIKVLLVREMDRPKIAIYRPERRITPFIGERFLGSGFFDQLIRAYKKKPTPAPPAAQGGRKVTKGRSSKGRKPKSKK
jgi:hypothetical protein